MRATQVFMAGDMLGVGVSLDGGATWLAPAWDSFLSWEMSDFSFDPALRRIYVASLSGPYYASFDAPLTWTSLRGGFPPPNGGTYLGTTQRVLVDPTANGSRLLAIGGNKRGWPRVGGQGIMWRRAGSNQGPDHGWVLTGDLRMIRSTTELLKLILLDGAVPAAS